jgi:hypothetical protein
LLKRFIAYYLPFDQGMEFQAPLIWQNARQYAYRNGIACLALVGISLAADAHDFGLAATATHGLAIVTTFFATVFTAAALDPRYR